MPRGKSSRNPGINPGINPAATPDVDPHVQALLLQLGSAQSPKRVRVLRLDESDPSKRFKSLGAIDADQFQLDEIGLSFGGGSYRLQIIDAQSGEVEKTASWEVDKSVQRRIVAPPSVPATSILHNAPTPATSADYAQMLQLERLRWEVEQLRSQRANAGQDANQITLRDLLPFMQRDGISLKDIIPLITNQNKSSVTELVEGMAAIDQIRGDTGKGGGGGDEGDNIVGLVTALINVAQRDQAAQAQAPTRQLPARAPQAAAAMPQRPPPAKPKALPDAVAIDAQTKAMRRLVVLVGIASDSNSANADDYAGVLWDAIEAGGFNVPDLLQHPTPAIVKIILQYAPSLEGKEDVLAPIIEAMKEMNQEDDDEASGGSGVTTKPDDNNDGPAAAGEALQEAA